VGKYWISKGKPTVSLKFLRRNSSCCNLLKSQVVLKQPIIGEEERDPQRVKLKVY